MKLSIAILNVIVLILSGFINCCTSNDPEKSIETLSIKVYKIDTTSIRAIHPIDKMQVYFAGSNGSVGVVNEDQQKTSIKFIRYQDSIVPHFRSLATNGTDYFGLSIGNPALLYNLSKDTIVYRERHSKVFYDSMAFFDANHGIAIGDPTENCLSIIVSNDGGSSWTKIPCSNLPCTAEGEAAFAASNTNIKVLGETAWVVTGGTKARVFKTMDLGKSWQVFETPIVQGQKSQGIYTIDFSDQNNGIIMGGDYLKPEMNSSNKAITKDGGKTWELVFDGQNPNYKSCVQYVPNSNGKKIFAVGKTGISYSENGGTTWREICKEAYYTIRFVDKNTAWLAGKEKIGKLVL